MTRCWILAPAALAALFTLAACTSAPKEPAERLQARHDCDALAAPVPATDIVLPTRGAVVTLTALQVQGAQLVCRVRGRVLPLATGLADLEFEVNLPQVWSGRAVQMGDGGFAWPRPAAAAAADDPLQAPAARPDRPSPLARGDVVFGLAQVQHSHREVDWAAAATQPEALRDLAYGAQKKLRDVAVALVRRRYGQAPDRTYYLGRAEAGRQALALAQRYPADYDGLFSLAPHVGWTGQHHAALRASLALAAHTPDSGWLRPAQVKWLAQSVRVACDGLDGLMDGVIGQVQACASNFSLERQRCPGGRPAGDRCLSDAQLAAVQTLHTPYVFGFGLAHGVRSHPGAVWGGEDLPPAGEAGGWLAWWTGLSPPALPVRVGQGLAWAQASQVIAQLYAQDPQIDLRRYDPGAVAGRVREVSALMDATDPQLSRFAALGGKLIVMEHLADQARSPWASVAYVDSLVARLGASTVERFVRLYTVPGAGHLGLGAASQIDMLQVLQDWVERAQPPGVLEVAQVLPLPQAPRGTPPPAPSTRPLCPWPAYPRYLGQGDPARAENFRCTLP